MTSSPNIPTPTPTPTPTPDTTPPTSTITSPTAGATVLIGTTVAITGTASDPGGGSVVRVEVSVDGGATFSAATGTNAWSFNWTPSAAGQATIRSRAVDNSGNVQNPPAEIQVTVDAPPTSTLTSPTEGATVLIGTQVAITGTASDAGGGSVVRVEVSVNGGDTYSNAVGTNAWTFNWTPDFPGLVTIKSRAVDNTGNVQNTPAEIHVTVDSPPTSTITSPKEGAIVLIGTQVAITGVAGDFGGGSVERVEVSVDGGATYSAAAGTHVWSFNWTPSLAGPVTIKSRAVDNTGNVQNPPSEVTVTVRTPIRVPSDQPTIQAAINVATNGDTVLVAPGTYPENINFGGKAITVTSESGPQVTVIDGGNADTVVVFTSGERRDSVLNGFTLQNGRSEIPGARGGIRVKESSPTITNNVIRNNRACDGSGIGIFFGSPLIQLNTITNNVNDSKPFCSGGGGGGISVMGAGSAEILDNVISNNMNPTGDGGGIYILADGAPIVKRNVIKGNDAGGRGGGIIILNRSDALIAENLITGNQAHAGGGLHWIVPQGSRGPILVNNTIADNNAISFGSGIVADGFDAQSELTNNIIVAKPGQVGLYCGGSFTQEQPIIRFNNIFSSGGMAYGGSCSDRTGTEGNISADPLFANPTQGDYHLLLLSPSIDAGDNQAPNLPDTDLDGDPRILDGDADGTATIDMGVDEVLLPPGFTWPISIIRSPVEGATVLTGTTVTITGLARDAIGGTVARVEVSVDGGATWNLATGTTAWSYDWMPATPGPATIKSRAVDDSGNVQDPPAEITVTVRTPVTIRVPSDQPTIQSAINVAGDGDTVLVAPGTYSEHINFRGKAITITSESGPDVTFIDGGNTDPVVSFISGEGRGSSLNGFRLQNGRAGIDNQGVVNGGGIFIQGSSPTITNNVITNNRACYGAGIGIRSGSPLIQLNTITNNDSNLCSLGGGSGIGIQGTSFVEILDNTISNNGMGTFEVTSSGGGIYMFGAGTLIIKRNIIKGNHVSDGPGGGIYLSNRSETLIVQNLITGNQAHMGAGLYWVADLSQGATLVNNTIADNAAAFLGSGIFANGFGVQTKLTNNIIVAKPTQSGLYCQAFGNQGPPIIRFNNIFSSGGKAYDGNCSNRTGTEGNISADPVFTNPALGDYHLQQGSPSIDTGDNQASNLPDTDIDGNPRILDGDGDGTAIVDMGVDEFRDGTPPTSTITSPTEGATVLIGTPVAITGTASDAGGGSVVKVEVSVDGGATYSTATGTTAWSFNWTPSAPGQVTIKSRAVDNTGNVQNPPAEIHVTVDAPPTVTSFSPAAGAVNVSVDINVIVTFSEAMDAATVNGATVELREDPSSPPVPATVSYDAATFTATLDPTAPLSAGVTYTALIRGGSADPRVKDAAGIALAADVTWTFTTTPPPLQVLSVTPPPGATDVLTGVAPRAVFSRPLDRASVNSSTVLLQDAASHPVGVQVRCSASGVVALVPNGLLQPLQTYTVTLKGGPVAPHITDSTGMPLPFDFTWTFTTAAAAPQTTIFAPTDTPAIPVVNDTEPHGVELGLKFRSDTDGIITGVRFYKGGPQNGGMHVGHFWTITGTLLRGVAFPGESESGWQQAIFQTPVPITAGETYVVSYFAPQKNYAATPFQFASSGVDAPPLHALSNIEANGNGVFRYNPNPSPLSIVFPNQSFNSTNFWVDVVFVNPALEPPRVLSTTPNPGALLVSLIPNQYSFPISATFSEPLDPATVNTTTVTLIDTAGAAVPINVSYTPGSLTVTITPLQGLQSGQAYTMTLKGGVDAPHITDLSGMPLASDFTWSITTNSLPEPASTEETMISNRVTTGANFIAMRPDKQLASLLGISDESSVRSEAYLLGDTARETGTGIVVKRLAVKSVRLP